jgi:hypothetical protein
MYYAEYICKSPYPYWVVIADDDLTKFYVWSKRKTFNARFHTEQQVIDLMEEKYPGSIRLPRPATKGRKKT